MIGWSVYLLTSFGCECARALSCTCLHLAYTRRDTRVCTSMPICEKVFFVRLMQVFFEALSILPARDISGCTSAGVKKGLGVITLAHIGVQERGKFP